MNLLQVNLLIAQELLALIIEDFEKRSQVYSTISRVLIFLHKKPQNAVFPGRFFRITRLSSKTSAYVSKSNIFIFEKHFPTKAGLGKNKTTEVFPREVIKYY